MSDEIQKQSSENLEKVSPTNLSKTANNLASQNESPPQKLSTSPVLSRFKQLPFWRIAFLGVIVIFLIGTFLLLGKGQVNTTVCLFNCSTDAGGANPVHTGPIISIRVPELVALGAAGAAFLGLTTVAGVTAVPAVVISGFVWLLFHLRP